MRMAVKGMVQQLSNEDDAGFVDLWDSFVGKEEMYMRDGLHLSGKGSAVFAIIHHLLLTCLEVSAVLPRRSAVSTVFGGATAINDGTTAELHRSWRCHCGLCRIITAVAPRIRCDRGITNPDCALGRN